MTAGHPREFPEYIESVGRQLSVGQDAPSTVFVGRERELAELADGITNACAGRGGLFLIVGEPGIGKTRLATELSRLASGRGACVLWGRCWEGEGAPAYWPWTQILRSYLREADAEAVIGGMGARAAHVAQIVPESRHLLPDEPVAPASIDSEHARFVLFDTITGLLTTAAEKRPFMLVLDDVHWADKASLLLLHFVARVLPRAAILVVATYREAEVRQSPELMDLVATMARDARHLPLRGLDEAAVRRMIEAIAGRAASAALAKTVREATEGNPYFVDELVRLLAAEGKIADGAARPPADYPIPQGVREAIRRRLKPCSDEARRLVAVASVLGREFEVSVLAPACDLAAERLLELLDEVLSVGMVVRTSAPLGRFAFSHALVRETFYDDLASADRGRLHAKIAQVLEAAYSANVEPHVAELAHHFLRAVPTGDPRKAIQYAVRAGRRARSQLAYDEAAAHFARAVELMERLEPPEERLLCEAMLELGEAQWEAGDPNAARATFLRAGERIPNLPDPRLLARAALGYMGLEGSVWAPIRPPLREEVELVEGALRELPETELALRARLLGRLAETLHFSPERARVTALATEAVALARRSADRLALIDALRAFEWTVASAPERAEERIAIDTEIVSLARVGEESFSLMAESIRLHALLQLGRTDGLLEEFDRFLRDLEAARRVTTDFNAALLRAMRALLAGPFERVEALAARALEIGQRYGPEPALAIGAFGIQMAFLRREQGRLDEVIEALRAPAVPGLAVTKCLLAWACAELGREEEARSELEALASEGFEAIPRDMFWLLSMGVLADAAVRVGHARSAAALYEALLPFAGQVIFLVLAVCTGSASRPLGGLASLLGRYDDAERHFEDAIALNEKLRATPWVARTRCEYARMLRARGGEGDAERATALLDQAIATARALGMKSLLEECEALRDAAPSRRTTAAPAGTVTLVFSDMEGFTEMTERLGDAAALEVARHHNRIVREQVQAYGGSELELQGDGFLLAFPKAMNAVECAIAIQRALAAHSAEHPEQPIRVRIGIHTGEPIKEADRYFGKSVILAARIAAQARGGEILVSSVVKDLCESLREVRFDEGREVELKGLAEKRRLYRVLGSRPERGPDAGDEAVTASSSNVFRREGSYWKIAYRGESLRLKDTIGLRYLAELLRHPGLKLHLTELAACVAEAPHEEGASAAIAAGLSPGRSDAGELLDDRARAAYRARLEELREARSAAERAGDAPGALAVERELEVFRRELARATGLGGRARRAGSDVERLRFSVTKAIKTAIRRIAQADPRLGHHLETTIRTGAFCAYAPDPSDPPLWTL